MRLLLFRLSYFVLLTSSCTTQPYQEMSDARQAIKAAQQAKVWQYSTDLTIAESYLKCAETALYQGQTEKARQFALLAKEQASQIHLLTLTLNTAYEQTQQLRYLDSPSINAEHSLEKAKQAIQSQETEHALHYAQEALRISEQQLNQYYLKLTQKQLETIHAHLTVLNEEDKLRLQAVEQAYQQQGGILAHSLLTPLMPKFDTLPP